MSPYREACVQMEHDQRYQAFLDRARKASVPIMLWHVQRLMEGIRDPTYAFPEHFIEMGDSEGWAKVIELIAQVQREHEVQAAAIARDISD
jgi:hypothetical protein